MAAPPFVFTKKGASALASRLEASDAYRTAARRWEGSLLLEVVGPDDVPPPVFLDLHHGRCREARVAREADRADATYVLAAPAETWAAVLDGSLDVVTALFGRKLRLERGRLLSLTPYLEAARQLVAEARDVVAEAEGAPQPEEEPGTPPAEAPASGRKGREGYQTTSGRGLDYDHPALRLWTKAKRDGIWDPFSIDLAEDRGDWEGLSELEREVVLHLTSQFQAGEESVTLDLLPLISVIAREGRLEEEIYLTSFLWEEAKHVELFRRFLDEVPRESGDLGRFHGPAYRRVFYEELPRALERLEDDASVEAQAEASVTYNMIVEGVLAETGYRAYRQMLEANDLMPGMRRAIRYLEQDESRHIAYGVFLLSRLVAEHGDTVWTAIDRRMSELLPLALDSVREVFASYETMPFGLAVERFVEIATTQFEHRYARVEKARHQTVADLFRQGDGLD